MDIKFSNNIQNALEMLAKIFSTYSIVNMRGTEDEVAFTYLRPQGTIDVYILGKTQRGILLSDSHHRYGISDEDASTFKPTIDITIPTKDKAEIAGKLISQGFRPISFSVGGIDYVQYQKPLEV